MEDNADGNEEIPTRLLRISIRLFIFAAVVSWEASQLVVSLLAMLVLAVDVVDFACFLGAMVLCELDFDLVVCLVVVSTSYLNMKFR